MRARTKKSVMSQLAAEQAARQAAHANVVPMVTATTSLESGIAEDGSETLHAVFPLPSGNTEKHDLTFLLGLSNLRQPLAEAFLRWGLNARGTTRKALAKNLRRGFVGFVSVTQQQDIKLEEVGHVCWTQFKSWLDQRKTKDGEPWIPSTRRQVLGNAISLFESLLTLPEYEAAARSIVNSAPRGAYPGSDRKNTPRDRLDWSHIVALKVAAEAEVRNIVERFDEGERLLAEGREKLAKGSVAFGTDFSVCLAAIVERFPGSLPREPKLKSELRISKLGNRLFHAARRHGYLRCASYRTATARDLVPFILLVCIATAFNPEQVLALELDDVRDSDNLADNVIISAIKHRGGGNRVSRTLPAGLSNEMGVRYLFTQLRRITDVARAHAGGEIKRWFLYRPAQTSRYLVQSFGNTRVTATANSVFGDVLAKFTEEHGLQPLSLSQIRATLVDETQARFGVKAAADLAGHRSLDTTSRHYTSSGTRRRGQQRIAEIQLHRDRWAVTKGAIDPRTRGDLERGAATPGFGCQDPMDSPLPAHKGKLCQAFGECPTCPFALAYTREPIAAAYYEALLEAIYAAGLSGRVSPAAWQTRWAPKAAALKNLLNAIPGETKAKMPSLPPLPPIG